MRSAALFLIPALLGAASIDKRVHRRSGPVSTSKEAKAIAERETGGKAVSAQRIPLNGASGGWEVDVHMPKEKQGWRCIIDADTHMVHRKTHIDNPPLSTRKRT